MMKKSLCRFARLFPLPLLAAPLFFASCSSDDSMTPIDEVKPPCSLRHVRLTIP